MTKPHLLIQYSALCLFQVGAEYLLKLVIEEAKKVVADPKIVLFVDHKIHSENHFNRMMQSLEDEIQFVVHDQQTFYAQLDAVLAGGTAEDQWLLMDLHRPALDFSRLSELLSRHEATENAAALSTLIEPFVITAGGWPALRDRLSGAGAIAGNIRSLKQALTQAFVGGEAGVTSYEFGDFIIAEPEIEKILEHFSLGNQEGPVELLKIIGRLRGIWPRTEDLVSHVVNQQALRSWDIFSQANRMNQFNSTSFPQTRETYITTGRETVSELLLRDDVLLGRAPKDLRVLEIGCGSGRILRALAESFGQAYGVDLIKDNVMEALYFCRDQDNAQATPTNGFDLAAYETDFLDIVVSFGVLEHVPMPWVVEGYMQETARTLKPGGTAVIHVRGRPEGTPMGHYPIWGEDKESRFGAPFTESELRAVFDRAGLEVKSLTAHLYPEDSVDFYRTDRTFTATVFKAG